MSLRKLGGETIVYGLSNILGRLLNFVIVTKFLTGIMSSEEYGVVGDLFLWTGLLIALLIFRMDTVVFRFASRDEYDAGAVFRRAQRFVVVLVLVCIGGMLLLDDFLADFLEYPDRVVYVQLVLATVAFDVLSAVPLARLRLEQRAWFFVGVNLGNVAVNLLLIYLFLVALPAGGPWFGHQYLPEYRVGYYLLTIAGAAAFRYLLLLGDGLRQYGRRRREAREQATPPRAPAVRTLLRYSLPLTIVSVAGVINSLFGPTFLKWYFGETVSENLYWSGQFNAAMKLAVFLNLFITAYGYAAEPFFFRQAGKDLATADRAIYADATRAYGIVGALASAGILLFLPWLKEIIDEGEQEGLYILPALLGANFLFGLYSNFAMAYKLTDRTYLGGAIAFSGTVVAITLSVLLVDRYTILAPAFGMLACYALMCLLAWLVSRRYFPVNYPMGRILLYVLLAAGAVFWGSSQDAMWGRGAVFVGLLAVFYFLERRWLQETFLRRK